MPELDIHNKKCTSEKLTRGKVDQLVKDGAGMGGLEGKGRESVQLLVELVQRVLPALM